MHRSQRRREERLQRKAAGNPWVPLARAVPVPFTEHQIAEHLDYGRKHGYKRRADARRPRRDAERRRVEKRPVPGRRAAPQGGPDAVPMVLLSIRRIDRQAIRDWRDFQRIKNQLVGAECEAVELYPAESRLVDSANQYFLYAVLDPTFRFPWGFGERLVTDESGGGSVQRPLDE